MTNTNTAAELAAKYNAEIISVSRYLARTGFAPDVVSQAVAEAVAQMETRPDIANPIAYMTTYARGTAEVLQAQREDEPFAGTPVPDLMGAFAQQMQEVNDKARERRRTIRQEAPTKPTTHRESRA